MDANLPKRPVEDPWSLYVGTTGQPGQNSIAEDLHTDALNIRDGKNKDPRLFYVYRWADGKYDLDVKEQRLAAIRRRLDLLASSLRASSRTSLRSGSVTALTRFPRARLAEPLDRAMSRRSTCRHGPDWLARGRSLLARW